jgi:hypothetical protein
MDSSTPLPKPVEKHRQRPAWMTAGWLAETAAARSPGFVFGDLAREILRLDAELAWTRNLVGLAEADRDLHRQRAERAEAERDKRHRETCAEMAAHVMHLEAERDAARAELAKLQEHVPTVAKMAQDLAEAEAELAERTRERDHNAKLWRSAEDELEKVRAERDAARAEVERLYHLADAGNMAMVNVISALNEAGRMQGPAIERIRDLACERDAAIRDRNEFAAREVERFAKDWADDSLVGDHARCAAARAAELRAGAVPIYTTPPADLHQSPADLHQLPILALPPDETPPAEPRCVKLPPRFWELVNRIDEDESSLVSEAMALLGDAVESVEVRP